MSPGPATIRFTVDSLLAQNYPGKLSVIVVDDNSVDDTAAAAACVGSAINDAAASQSVTYLKSGNLDINAVATKGTVYVVSAAAGKIAPVADLVSTNFVTILGVASSTTRINIKLNATGVVV